MGIDASSAHGFQASSIQSNYAPQRLRYASDQKDHQQQQPQSNQQLNQPQVPPNEGVSAQTMDLGNTHAEPWLPSFLPEIPPSTLHMHPSSQHTMPPQDMLQLQQQRLQQQQQLQPTVVAAPPLPQYLLPQLPSRSSTPVSSMSQLPNMISDMQVQQQQQQNMVSPPPSAACSPAISRESMCHRQILAASVASSEPSLSVASQPQSDQTGQSSPHLPHPNQYSIKGGKCPQPDLSLSNVGKQEPPRTLLEFLMPLGMGHYAKVRRPV